MLVPFILLVFMAVSFGIAKVLVTSENQEARNLSSLAIYWCMLVFGLSLAGLGVWVWQYIWIVGLVAIVLGAMIAILAIYWHRMEFVLFDRKRDV